MIIFVILCVVVGILSYTIVCHSVTVKIGQVRIIESDGAFRVIQFARFTLSKFDAFYGGGITDYDWRYVEPDGSLDPSPIYATYNSKERATKIADLARKNYINFLEWKKTHPNRVNEHWKYVD